MKTYEEIQNLTKKEKMMLKGPAGDVLIKRTQKGATVALKGERFFVPEAEFENRFGNLNSIGLHNEFQ